MEALKTWLVNWNTNSKTALTRETYSAFLITLTGMKLLIKRLLAEENALFVLTGRFQQDPIEERFGAHRQRAGCSYNPSALQFQQTEKKLSVLKSINQNSNGNTTRAERKTNRQLWNNKPLLRRAKKRQVCSAFLHVFQLEIS